jgi:hypothetical protein
MKLRHEKSHGVCRDGACRRAPHCIQSWCEAYLAKNYRRIVSHRPAVLDPGETMDAGGTSAATEYHDRRAVRVASPNRAALGVYGGTSSDG